MASISVKDDPNVQKQKSFTRKNYLLCKFVKFTNKKQLQHILSNNITRSVINR